MTPAARVASDTWNRLRRARSLGARLGEETLTDLLVLDMLPHGTSNGFGIKALDKQQEAKFGADLWIWIRYPHDGYRRLLVQAKKLYHNNRYHALNYKRGKQLNDLEKAAWMLQSGAAYLLYNYVRGHSSPHCQQCGKSNAVEQLGCTLAPSWIIRQIVRRRKRSFDDIHRHDEVGPWRCIFDCPSPSVRFDDLFGTHRLDHLEDPEERRDSRRRFIAVSIVEAETRMFESLYDIDEQASTEFVDELYGQLLSVRRDERRPEAELIYPRRILAVDIERLEPDWEELQEIRPDL